MLTLMRIHADPDPQLWTFTDAFLTQEVSILEAALETLPLHDPNHLHHEVFVTLSAQHEGVVLCQSLAKSADPPRVERMQIFRRFGQ
jgi:hypothetical protein